MNEDNYVLTQADANHMIECAVKLKQFEKESVERFNARGNAREWGRRFQWGKSRP